MKLNDICCNIRTREIIKTTKLLKEMVEKFQPKFITNHHISRIPKVKWPEKWPGTTSDIVTKWHDSCKNKEFSLSYRYGKTPYHSIYQKDGSIKLISNFL